MSGLIATLVDAPADAPLFKRADGWITAGDIRQLAQRAPLARREGPIFAHVGSAAHLCAALLVAAAERRVLALPAHAQEGYLAEIGAAGALLDDDAFARAGAARALDGAIEDPLLIFYTSGSTGTPKRVDKNLSRIETEARALDDLWGDEAGHVAATVSHQHIYGLLFRIVWPLLSGRTADDAAALYWEDLKDRLEDATLVASPAHLTRLPPHSDVLSPPPRLIFSSGQLLTPGAARDCIAAFGRPVTEVLGSTETGGIAWRRQDTADEPWTPLPPVRIETGEGGALIVRSPFLQEDQPLATGDVIELHEDGHFRLKPRGDRVAKIGGKRVSLARVEQALQELGEIEVAAALTLAERSEELAAIVVLSADGREALQELGPFRLSRRLRGALASALEPAERPKHWRFVSVIPTDSQGKRVLSSLRAMFASSPLDALDYDTRSQTADEAEIAFTLPSDLIFFDGHFPERAVLPGLAQVHLAVLFAERFWGGWPSDADLARLKFRRVLMPGDAVVLTLKWNAQTGRLRFAYRFRDIDAAQGEIGGFKS
ncbi:MAG: AMP-binding protein [Vitreimonas sp.]